MHITEREREKERENRETDKQPDTKHRIFKKRHTLTPFLLSVY